MSKKSSSGKKTTPKKKSPLTLTPEQQYRARQQSKLSKIRRDLYGNIREFSHGDRLEMITKLVNSLNNELDDIQRKIQTKSTPEEKKKKYRHLFDENGWGMIMTVSNDFYHLGGEGTTTEEIHVDKVDWKNVSGTMDHYEYGEIPVVFERTPITSFLDEPAWKERIQLKKMINESLDTFEKDLTKFKSKKDIDDKTKWNMKDTVRSIDHWIHEYTQIGWDDEINEEATRLIKIRKVLREEFDINFY